MKKDFIFAPILFLAGIALCLLRVTGITAHIIISVVGIIALVAYTVLTKKEWKIPALEIAMRVSYGIALISGVVIMAAQGLTALAVIHRIFAALFLAALVVLLAHKLLVNKKG